MDCHVGVTHRPPISTRLGLEHGPALLIDVISKTHILVDAEVIHQEFQGKPRLPSQFPGMFADRAP
jgi:hypothetical protein